MVRASVTGYASCFTPPRGFDSHDRLQNSQIPELPIDSFVAGDPIKKNIVAPYLGLMNEAYWQKIAESTHGVLPLYDANLSFAIGEATYKLASSEKPRAERSILEKLYDLAIPDADAEPLTVVSISVAAILKGAAVLIAFAGCLIAKPDGPWDEDEDGYMSDTDCNDNNPDIHPGASDTTCDGVDQNCDEVDGPPGEPNCGIDIGDAKTPSIDDGGKDPGPDETIHYSDGGRSDGGSTDGGLTDAGYPVDAVYNDTLQSDASAPDAGVPDVASDFGGDIPDAGAPDAASDLGAFTPDAGALDASSDLGAFTPDAAEIPDAASSDSGRDAGIFLDAGILDTDLDGLSDDDEMLIGTDPINPDSDSDMLWDNVEVGGDLNNPLDTDFDTIINALDPDDDNDGIPTDVEVFYEMDPLNGDSDRDGLSDFYEAGDPNDPIDTDGDGHVNANDPDSDGDGANDRTDNCYLIHNPGQENLDSDRLGNACDNDADEDGFDSVAAGGTDCDDLDRWVNPTASEVACDRVDNDCSAATPDDADMDHDGSNCSVDCNDENNSIHPGTVETEGDGVDNNCDGYEHAWTRVQSIGDNDAITSLAADAAGGAWATGYATRTGENTNSWCAYVDASGSFSTPWINSFNVAGRDMGNSIALDATGENILFTGMLTFTTRDGAVWSTPASVPIAEPARLFQFDGSANLEDTSNDVIALEDGSMIVLSSLTNATGDTDIDIRRVSSVRPEPIWRTSFGAANGRVDKGLGLFREAGSDIFYFTGRMPSTSMPDRLILGAVGIDGSLTGARKWQRTYETIESRDANTKRIVAIDENGFLQIAAEQRITGSGFNANLHEVDPANGDILSTRTIMNTIFDDWLNALVVDEFGNRLVAGAYQSADAAFMIVNPAGEIIWQKIINGVANRNDGFTTIAIGSDGNVFAGGYINAAPGDALIMRLEPR